MRKLTDKLSVRFITRKWAPAVGGMETYCLQLTDHIRKDVNLEIHALPGQANGNAPPPLRILTFGLKMSAKLFVLPATEVTHISDMASWPLAFLAKLRRPKTRIVLSAHGSDLSYGERSGALAKIYKLYMKMGARLLPGAAILANSQWIANLAKKTGFKDVRLIPLASNIAPYSKALPVTKSLFFAGRIMRSKGTSFVAKEILPNLPEDINLRIAGTVWEAEEGRILNDPRVNYLGQLSEEELAKEYASALAVLVPSLSPEGFGLVAVEAALAGGVVIASNHTGLAEVCSDGIGILAETGEAKDWSSKIIFIASWTDETRDIFIQGSQSQARKRYNWKRVADDTLRAYKPDLVTLS